MFCIMSKTHTISSTDLVRQIRPLLDAVLIDGDEVVITRYGQPQAVIRRYADAIASESRPTDSAPSLGLPDQMGTVSAYTLEGEDSR
jgi:antitoxin (DNA-binding transcriptional repressor) of toxin-antitoxin stability system